MVGSVDHLPLHLWTLLWKCQLFFGTQNWLFSTFSTCFSGCSSVLEASKSEIPWLPILALLLLLSFILSWQYLLTLLWIRKSINWSLGPSLASRRHRSALCRLVPAAVTGARSPGFLGFILAHCPQSQTFNFAHAAILQVTTMRNHVITSYNGRHKLS